ncbi:MAG TPA: 3'-5' exonuclease [Methylibium sp.]|nr:3'-5' exonuclease [Methylibium sp.]
MSLLGRLRSLWSGPGSGEIDDARWVVVDVESSGLDASRDRLLAIAAVALHFDAARRRPRIVLADGFEVVLRQDDAEPVDKANILLHGIGVGAQRAGVDPPVALARWRDWLGRSPLVAYHGAFDATLIGRAARAQLRADLPNPWLDLAPLAAVLHADPQRRGLDHWLQRHGIACLGRHAAAADALATAELLLALWPALRGRCDGSFAAVEDLSQGQRFLPGRR